MATKERDVKRALAARQKANAALAAALRGLPEGNMRKRSVAACIDAGITPAEVQRLMGLSRQRVYQLERGGRKT